MPTSSQPPAADAPSPTPRPASSAPQPPAPLDPPMVPLALGGMAIWALVGLALLPFRHELAVHGHGSWLWICLAGFLVGIAGLAVMKRHDAGRRRRRERSIVG